MFNFTMISQDDDQRIASIDYVKLTQYQPTPWTIKCHSKGDRGDRMWHFYHSRLYSTTQGCSALKQNNHPQTLQPYTYTLLWIHWDKMGLYQSNTYKAGLLTRFSCQGIDQLIQFCCWWWWRWVSPLLVRAITQPSGLERSCFTLRVAVNKGNSDIDEKLGWN